MRPSKSTESDLEPRYIRVTAKDPKDAAKAALLERHLNAIGDAIEDELLLTGTVEFDLRAQGLMRNPQ